jgi:adenylate cyclase, class 2
MASPKEVEIKFLVDDAAALARKLKAIGFRLQTRPTHEMNTLYDLPDRSLRARGQLLRLRHYGDGWVLTHKGKSAVSKHKVRVELETAVADGARMDAILRALGYTPAFRYEKYRAEYANDHGHVVIDETPIGCLGEIEGPPRWIDRTAKQLGITPEQYITKSYAELFFEWKARTGSPAEEMTFQAISPRKRIRK